MTTEARGTVLTQIPKPALILGLAGTLPFIAGAVMLISPGTISNLTGVSIIGVRVMAPTVLLIYSQVILTFMSGVLWGFATKAEGRLATIAYIASVVPALFVFFTALLTIAAPSLLPYAIGFALLLLIDFGFWRAGLAPVWWMRLRIAITVIVLITLITALSIL